MTIFTLGGFPKPAAWVFSLASALAKNGRVTKLVISSWKTSLFLADHSYQITFPNKSSQFSFAFLPNWTDKFRNTQASLSNEKNSCQCLGATNLNRTLWTCSQSWNTCRQSSTSWPYLGQSANQAKFLHHRNWFVIILPWARSKSKH